MNFVPSRTTAYMIFALALSPALRPTILPAQDSTTVRAAESARAAWREVVAAFNNDDLETASDALARATEAWPTQPVYQRARALVAARIGDHVALLESINAMIEMQSNDRLLGDSAIRSAREDIAIDRALDRLETASAPLIRSTAWQTITDSTFYAEGIDADPATGSAYVASIRHRTVVEIDSEGSVRDLNLSRHGDIGAVFGVRVDGPRNALWITTATLPSMEGYANNDGAAALVRVDPATGDIEQFVNLAVAGEHPIPGDLTLGPGGRVFVTDSRVPRVIVFDPDSGERRAITHALFRSLQGLAVHRDGRHLFVADYSHGILLVDLETDAVYRLDDAPGTTSLGVDGIALRGQSIIAVQNGVVPPRIVEFVLDSTISRIVSATVLDRNVPLADEPTIGTILEGDFLYVANSQWEKYDDDGNRREGSSLAPTILLRLPLREGSR